MPRGAEVGQVTDLWVYPFKGMQGVPQDELTFRSISVVGDRRYGFITTEGENTPNWLDTIKYPGLLTYKTRFDKPDNPQKSDVIIQAPEGAEYSAVDPELLERISAECSRKLALVNIGRSLVHSMSLSLLGNASIDAIAKAVDVAKRDVDFRRFRMNVLFNTTPNLPYQEDTWVGKEVKFGDNTDGAIIDVKKPDQRCLTVNLNPETGAKDLNVLRPIARGRGNNFGMYADAGNDGTKIRQGDIIRFTR